MKKVTFAILGMGNRGTAYAGKQLKFPEEMEVVAMADTRRERLDSANKYLHLPEDRLFDSAEAILSAPKLADIMVIATQDAQHRDHAIRAMELGYDLLLEKPIANNLQDVTQIYEAAQRLGRRVVVCHVLRYTPFYRKAKELLDQGVIGKICSIEAAEHVGYYHQAHSFVRGNWHNSEASSPMILAKCCHDMDILTWLAGKNCKSYPPLVLCDISRKKIARKGQRSAAQTAAWIVLSTPSGFTYPGSPAGPPTYCSRNLPRRIS